MNPVTDNAFLLLRVMVENQFVLYRDVTTNQLKQLSGLDETAYDQAETYLFHSKLIDGAGGGEDGTRTATSTGIDYFNQVMQSRIPLSLNAERILRYIVQNVDDRNSRVRVNQVEDALGLDKVVVNEAFIELNDEGLIRCPVKDRKNGRELSVTQWGAVASSEGRNALRSNFRLRQAPTTQIAAIYNAPVTANNLVNAINSQIEQTFNQNDPSAILQSINDTLKSLSDSVTPKLELEQQIAYLQAISNLKTELSKPNPDPSSVAGLMKFVAFADNFNGMVELGIKAFTVGALASPYVPILFEQIKILFKALGIPT